MMPTPIRCGGSRARHSSHVSGSSIPQITVRLHQSFRAALPLSSPPPQPRSLSVPRPHRGGAGLRPACCIQRWPAAGAAGGGYPVAQGNTGGVRGGADGGAREKWLYISYTCQESVSACPLSDRFFDVTHAAVILRAAPTKFEAEWATSETHRLVALDDPSVRDVCVGRADADRENPVQHRSCPSARARNLQ